MERTNVLRATLGAIILPVLCATSALVASAQNVQNPKTVEFDPSADHDAVTSGGESLVERYDLLVFLQGASAPISTASLGKPAADADGKIRVDFSTLLVGWPLANGTYEARVAAVGPTGSGQSEASNAFDFTEGTAACTYALSASSESVAYTGGAAVVTVVPSATTCAWTAESPASWVAVSPGSGTGSGAVTVTVAANAGVARTATLTIAGQSHTVSQAAVACSFFLSSSSAALTAAGGSSSVGVTANLSTCSWTASSSASWVTVSSASGTGSSTVAVTVAANTGAARTATVTVAGQSYAVSQAALVCTFAVSSSSLSLAAAGGAFTMALTANASVCGWSASSSVGWIALSSTSGTGSASVGYTVERNKTGSTRSGTFTVASQVISVTQASVPRPGAPRGVATNVIATR
jgi:hypothetical protein